MAKYDGWKIAKKGNKHILQIFVDGRMVKEVESYSERYLSSIANQRYTLSFNKYNSEGWKMALV